METDSGLSTAIYFYVMSDTIATTGKRSSASCTTIYCKYMPCSSGVHIVTSLMSTYIFF